MKRMNPKEQFSKKLATWTAQFWFLYMMVAAAICVWAPGSADAAVYLAICASVIMLINVGAYTRNSVYEKAILAGMEKARFALTWKKTQAAAPGAETENDEADEAEDFSEDVPEGEPEDEESGENG